MGRGAREGRPRSASVPRPRRHSWYLDRRNTATPEEERENGGPRRSWVPPRPHPSPASSPPWDGTPTGRLQGAGRPGLPGPAREDRASTPVSSASPVGPGPREPALPRQCAVAELYRVGSLTAKGPRLPEALEQFLQETLTSLSKGRFPHNASRARAQRGEELGGVRKSFGKVNRRRRRPDRTRPKEPPQETGRGGGRGGARGSLLKPNQRGRRPPQPTHTHTTSPPTVSLDRVGLGPSFPTGPPTGERPQTQPPPPLQTKLV